MCANRRPRQSPLYVISNWNQDLPLRVKLAKAAKNFWIRVSTPATCCGHPGEPGC